MPFARRTLTQLRDGALADISASLIYDSTTGATINPLLLMFDPLTIMAKVMAGLAYEEYGYLDYISLQATPATATDEQCLSWGALKGLGLEPASPATAVAAFTGVLNSPIPIGSLVSRQDGTAYATTAAGVIGPTLGVNLPIQAVATGSAGTLVATAALTLQLGLPGVDTAAVVFATTAPGTDLETFDAFRARYLFAFANPPAGGSLTDYVQWATDVNGVTRAWTQGQFQGPGTVGVYIMLDISEAAANNGFPVGTVGTATLETRDVHATGDELDVANAIYPKQPVTALVYVLAPAPELIQFVITGLGTNNTAAVQTAILDGIQAAFLAVGTPLGQVIPPSVWESALSSALGSIPFVLVSPVAPLTIPVGSLPIVTAASVACNP